MLLNVRLNDDDERLVGELRKRGIKISDVVRAAIRTEAALQARIRPRNRLAEIDELIARHPTPPGARRENRPALDDRRAVARFIVRHLKRRR